MLTLAVVVLVALLGMLLWTLLGPGGVLLALAVLGAGIGLLIATDVVVWLDMKLNAWRDRLHRSRA